MSMIHPTRYSFTLKLRAALAVALAISWLSAGCGKSGQTGNGGTAAKVTVQNKGSDTMVNLAQA
jgi:ABC-type phosphate transport system substrate-binding protein